MALIWWGHGSVVILPTNFSKGGYRWYRHDKSLENWAIYFKGLKQTQTQLGCVQFWYSDGIFNPSSIQYMQIALGYWTFVCVQIDGKSTDYGRLPWMKADFVWWFGLNPVVKIEDDV